ncbi:hypothetical protein Mapa_013384 [Marchantia paleacea]|nr:hypothetical protein Mapa_013384 [Marchantia paleacea]
MAPLRTVLDNNLATADIRRACATRLRIRGLISSPSPCAPAALVFVNLLLARIPPCSIPHVAHSPPKAIPLAAMVEPFLICCANLLLYCSTSSAMVLQNCSPSIAATSLGAGG